MSDPGQSPNLERPPITSVVHMRIERRIDVFTEWLKKRAVPVDLVEGLPDSLTKLRLWEVPSLGIVKTTDPNSWTRDHPDWGPRVVQADKLMKEVLNLAVVPKQKATSTETIVKLRTKVKELTHLLQRHLGDWQIAQDAAAVALIESKSFQARLKAMEERLREHETTLKERDNQLAETRRELAALQGLPRLASK